MASNCEQGARLISGVHASRLFYRSRPTVTCAFTVQPQQQQRQHRHATHSLEFSRRALVAFPLVFFVFPAGTCRGAGNTILRSLGIGDPDIYYPGFFEGLWNCYSTLIDVATPQGEDKADSKSVNSARKQLGYTVSYQARFLPYKGNVIGDRMFTTTSLVEAMMGKNVIEGKTWDPEHANRFSLVLSGGLKVENLVTKRSFEMSAPGQFDTSEYSKQVFDRAGQPGPPLIKASRNMTRYKWDPEENPVNSMEVLQRVSMYQVPGESLENMDLFNMNSPVAVYKYVVQFKRSPEDAQEVASFHGFNLNIRANANQVDFGFMACVVRWFQPPSHRTRRLTPSCARQAPGWVHFVGIGGTGLSALALLAIKQGWKVSGSDASWSSKLKLLEEAGAVVYAGHTATQLESAGGSSPDTVVVSSAVPSENVEVVAARERGVPVLKRAEWLGKITKDYELIAVAGTHGKSTTTAMLALALQSLGEDVTAVVGADVPQFSDGSNVLCGNGTRFVLEADEYDGCFLGVNPSLALVTNVEWEHVDMFPDEDSVREMFRRFVARVKPQGCLVICGDSAGTRSLYISAEKANQERNDTVQTVTYGLDAQNDWRAIMLVPNLQGGTDYVAVHKNRPMAKVSLKVPGIYNVLNSLAVIVSAALLTSKAKGPGLADSARLKVMAVVAQAAGRSLQSFEGIRRRFEYIGTVRQCHIYDDYAHHPTEVRAVLQAARQRFDQQPIWVVFQPHTYSRLAMLLQDFAPSFSGADRVIVTEVFSAREDNVWNISGSDLASAITGPTAMFIASLDEVIERLSWEIVAMEKNDANKRGNIILLTLGAGDITSIGPKLLQRLGT